MPDSASDVWAFGMLLVRLLRGQLPQQHLQLVTCPAFRYGNPAVDPRTQPGFKAVLEYLTGLLCSGTNYAAQVKCTKLLASTPEEHEGMELLLGLIARCLELKKQDRIRATQLSTILFDFMTQKDWYNAVNGGK